MRPDGRTSPVVESTFPPYIVPPPARRAVFATARDMQNFDDWRRSLDAIYDISLPEGQNPAGFRFHGITYHLGRSFLSRASGSSFVLTRDARHITENPMDVVSLFLCEDGHVDFDYDGLLGTLEPGDVVVLDYQRPMASTATDYRCSTIFLDRAVAPMAFRAGHHHGVVLRASRTETQLLSDFLGALYATLDEMALAEAEAAARTLFEHAARLYAIDERLIEPSSGRRLAQAIDIIRANLTNASLTADKVAQEVGVSRANLYRLFAPLGGVRAHILNMRLDAAYDRLAHPRGTSVGEVAAVFGFRTSSHFSRAFRSRFKVAPGEIGGSPRRAATNILGSRIIDI